MHRQSNRLLEAVNPSQTPETVPKKNNRSSIATAQAETPLSPDPDRERQLACGQILISFFEDPQTQKTLQKHLRPRRIACLDLSEEIECDIHGIPFAQRVDLEVQSVKDAEEDPPQCWIVFTYDENRCPCYALVVDEKEIAFSKPLPLSRKSLLREESEHHKVVKSRPPRSYPDLFRLQFDEVWPNNAKTLVVGDPYQACDREGVTIVEYEYAQEMVPPAVIQTLFTLAESSKNRLWTGLPKEDIEFFLRNTSVEISAWIREIMFEDFRYIQENMFGCFFDQAQNPIIALADHLVDLVGEIYHQSLIGKKSERGAHIPSEKNLRDVFTRLREGTWTRPEMRRFLNIPEDRQAKDLNTLYDLKQRALEAVGNPEQWKGFVEHWNAYLERLPMDLLPPAAREDIPQISYLLETLPHIKGRGALDRALHRLRLFYETCTTVYREDDPRSHAVYDAALSDTRQDVEINFFSDSFFGILPPGMALPYRAQRILQRLFERLDQAHDYCEHVLPRLREQLQHIVDEHIPIKYPAKILHETEHALAADRYFKKRTVAAVPLHGFFPTEMPTLDPQDRILALTSVTMHGWNELTSDEIYEDFKTSLPFLKIGGKYILGPINQSVYFQGSYQTEEDEPSLLPVVHAIQRLRDEGRIMYVFHVLTNEDGTPSNRDAPLTEERSVLYENEAAASLVITRIT